MTAHFGRSMEMASRSDVVSVDALWDVFDDARSFAWKDHENSKVGSGIWKMCAHSIDVINYICDRVHDMQPSKRDVPNDEPKKPILKSGTGCYISCKADGTAEVSRPTLEEFVCPVCGNYVGELVISPHFRHKHVQSNFNFCQNCGQRLDWSWN